MFFCTRPSIFYGNRAYMTYRANENVTPPSIKITNLRIISPLFCKILPKSTYLHVKRRYNINDKTLSSLYGHTITLITTCTLHNDVINVHVQTHAASPFFSKSNGAHFSMDHNPGGYMVRRTFFKQISDPFLPRSTMFFCYSYQAYHAHNEFMHIAA